MRFQEVPKELPELILTSTDTLITLIYFALVLSIAFALRSRINTGADFFQAGRTQPAWLCALAFLAAGMGAPEVICLGAAGARYGFVAASFFLIGAIPAMLFVGILMMPSYYGSKARSVPGFLRLRFDAKTAALSACLFAMMAILSSAVSLWLVARIIQALHIFDGLFRAMGWPLAATFVLSAIVPAVVVLATVAMSGLRGVIRNQAVQFLVLVAGLLPVVFLGLKKIGGLGGLAASLPAANLHPLSGDVQGGSIANLAVALALGLVLGASFWCSDFRVLQFAMAAKNMDSARRAPLFAAVLALFLPLLLIVPGMVSIGLPTPRTTATTRYENGAIFHETTVVPPEAELGNGLVPARVDPATRKPMLDANGQVLLNYEMATPNLLTRVLPNGLLGLGLTALLAALMSGLAASVTAFNTVFTYDLYGAFIRKQAADAQYLTAGRWTTTGAVLLSIGIAYAAVRLDNLVSILLLAFSAVIVPLFAVVLLGMFWRRATSHAAFAGLIAGATAALLHHGLTLPIGTHRGVGGGWIAVLHHHPNNIAQSLLTAVLAFGVASIVTVVVSLCTRPTSNPEMRKMALHA